MVHRGRHRYLRYSQPINNHGRVDKVNLARSGYLKAGPVSARCHPDQQSRIQMSNSDDVVVVSRFTRDVHAPHNIRNRNEMEVPILVNKLNSTSRVRC